MADADNLLTALAFIRLAAEAAAQGQARYDDFLAQHVKEGLGVKLKSGRDLIALLLGVARIIHWQGKKYVFLHDRVHYLKFEPKDAYGEIKVIAASYVHDSIPYFIFAVSLNGQFYSTGPQPHPTIAGEVFNSKTGLEIFSTSDGTACMAFGISHKIVWDQLKKQQCYTAVFRQSKLSKNPQFPRHNSSPGTVQQQVDSNDEDDMDIEDIEEEEYVDYPPQQIATPSQQKHDIVALMSQMDQDRAQGRHVDNFWDVISKLEALGNGLDVMSLWPLHDSNILSPRSDLTNAATVAAYFSESDPRVPFFDDNSEDLLADSVNTIEMDKEE